MSVLTAGPAATTLDVDGTTVSLRRAGSGEPVLFLHGHWATARWLPLHAALAESVDLIAPDTPGFGDSPAPEWLLGRDDLVLFYRDLLDTLGLGSVHVAGYGLGGWIAADLAVWFPERVRSLALLAPFGLRVPGEPIADVFLMNPAAYDDAYYNGEPVPGLVPGVGTPADGGPEGFSARYGEMGTAAKLMWQRRYDLKLETRLPRLSVRALVVRADDDRIVPAAHAERWTELLGAQLVTVPGAGHAFPITEPSSTADALTAFVLRHEEQEVAP